MVVPSLNLRKSWQLLHLKSLMIWKSDHPIAKRGHAQMSREWDCMWKSIEVPDLIKKVIFSSIPVRLSKDSSISHHLTKTSWKPRWEDQICLVEPSKLTDTTIHCFKPFCMGWFVEQQLLMAGLHTFMEPHWSRFCYLISTPLGTHDLLYCSGKGRESWGLHTNF